MELNQIAAYLKMIGSDRHDRLSSPAEDRLAGKAVEWSAELRMFASIIAAEVTL